MELNDPVDLLALKVLGIGVKLDFIAIEALEGAFLPSHGELCLEISAAVWRKRWVWTMERNT